MRTWKTLLLAPLALVAACSATGSGPLDAPPDPDALAAALDAELFGGGELDLNASLRDGRPVALVFWQAWWSACIDKAPSVESAHTTYRGRIDVVGVVSGPDASVDEDKLGAAIFQNGMSYPQVRDRDLALTELLGVSGVPTVVVLAPDGTVVYREHGLPPDWDAFL